MKKLSLILLLCLQTAFAIGAQHGIFASRSTQGAQWNGNASIIGEHYTITVMPSYLDIELDWEFDCSGVEPDSFKNALEIVGNLNLIQNSAVTGMLLWNGDEILKAKLKPVTLAREEYEKVVDRNADTARRPRDPVILEYGWGKDNYDISIFPVSWKGSRKLRMRYVVEAINIDGHADIPFPTAFNEQIATYTLKTGAGVSAFSGISIRGAHTAETGSMSFAALDSSYRQISMIRPVIGNPEGKSVFYTAAMDLDSLRGTVTHVIGQDEAGILSTAGLREDFVVVWRWNHPEYIGAYRKQLVRQAEILGRFLEKFDGSDKRAALVVDIAGEEKTVFNLGSKGTDTFRDMVDFVDSLSGLDYVDAFKSFDPEYTDSQVDSLMRQAQTEFEETIRLAMSLFDDDGYSLQRIILLTAGPNWITRYDPTYSFIADSGVELTTFAKYAKFMIKGNIEIPPEAFGFYWPGIYFGHIRQFPEKPEVEAVLTTEAGETITVPVNYSGTTQPYYSGSRSTHLDKKLYSGTGLKPTITWRLRYKGKKIAEYPEEPLIIAQSDPIQFACALAGTESLEVVDGTLPGSLASTLGFVDQTYALLALEEDVMEAPDQERYRLTGVPQLTEADIIIQPDPSVPPEKNTDLQPPATATESIVSPARNNSPSIRLQQSILHIAFGRNRVDTPRKATVCIYTLSGKLLLRISDEQIRNGTIQIILPRNLRRTHQALIVSVTAGAMTFTRPIPVR